MAAKLTSFNQLERHHRPAILSAIKNLGLDRALRSRGEIVRRKVKSARRLAVEEIHVQDLAYEAWEMLAQAYGEDRADLILLDEINSYLN